MSEINSNEFAARTERRDWEDDDKGYVPRPLNGSEDYDVRPVVEGTTVTHSPGEDVEQTPTTVSRATENDWYISPAERAHQKQALDSVREANKHLWSRSR